MSRKRRVGLTRLSLVRPRPARAHCRCSRWRPPSPRACRSGGWLLVRDAIDNGIRAHDTSRLDLDVAIYVGVNAAAWLVGSFLILGLARLGQLIVLRLREHLFGHLTTLSLRYFSEQRAGWIISRITNDVDALSDVLSEGLSTLVGNVLTLDGRDDRAGDRSTGASRSPRMVILPPTMVVVALVPDALSRGLRRRPHADLRAHRADRRVARRHGRDPVLQPRGRLPEAVHRAQPRQPARQPARTEPLVAVLPRDRAVRRDRDRRGACARPRACTRTARSRSAR